MEEAGANIAEETEEVAPDSALQGVTASFEVTLHPTYYRTGFFNVRVESAEHFGGDGEMIEIHLPGIQSPVLGTINRTANLNGTPRIMGGTGVRDWFQRTSEEKDVVTVEILSPTAIRLSKGAAE